MFESSTIELDYSALLNNLKVIRRNLGPDVLFSSVVKGNAYGHGIVEFVPMAEKAGVSHFSVFSAAEAYLIRNNDKDGVRRSNSGFQGYHSKDIRDLSNLQGTNQLIKQIINAVNVIHQISRKGEVQLTNFWINISGKGSSNTPHTHSGLTYSGVFFIKVPKEMKGGRFLFYRNFNEADFISTEYMGHFKEGYQMQGYDYPINTISPKENMLVVFPAWVPHAVEINLSDEERISLSFNFKLNRTFSRVK